MLDTREQYLSPASMALQNWEAEPVLPVMNLEPMYEAHGYGNRFGRFRAEDVRRAFWYSVLSGAKAGFAYGAHGIWMFYDGSGFNNEHWSKIPLCWRDALPLQGAQDMVDSAALFEEEALYDIEPRQELNVSGYDEIRIAATPDLDVIVAYTPCTTYLDLTMDLSGYSCTWHVLDRRIQEPCSVEITSGEALRRRNDTLSAGQRYPLKLNERIVSAQVVSRVAMVPYNSDAVLICKKSQ